MCTVLLLLGLQEVDLTVLDPGTCTVLLLGLQEVDLTVLDPATCAVLLLLGLQEVDLTVIDPATCTVLLLLGLQEVDLTVLDPATCTVLFLPSLQEVDLSVLDPATCLVNCSVVIGSARGPLNCPRPTYVSCVLFCCYWIYKRSTYLSSTQLRVLSTVLLLLGLQEVDLTVLDPATCLVYCSVVIGSTRG